MGRWLVLILRLWHRCTMRFLCIFIALTAFIAMASHASAQEKVAARSGAHDGYTRLVFEWTSKPEYSISKDGARILIRFGKAGEVDLSGVTQGESNVSSVKTISSAGEPLQVAVEIPSGSRFRDFTVSNKMILDIYDPEGAAKKTEPVKPKEPEAAKPVKTEKIKPAEKKKEEPKKETPKADFSITPTHSEEAVPVTDVEAAKVPPPALDPHVITLTSTSNIGLAVFERGSWLWMVMDGNNSSIVPVVTGPQKDKLPPLTKIDVPQGVAYRMDIPEGLKVYAEGGGLSWRIVLGPKDQHGSPAMASAEADGGTARLFWPLQNMRKAISFADPIVGDQITVVTASDASQFTGAVRDFVDLQTLKSTVGLAYLSKTDDLKTTIGLQKVSVGKVGGLTLSAAKDVAPQKIRQEVNETEEAVEEPKAEEKAPVEEHTQEKPAEEGHADKEAKQEEAHENKDSEHEAAEEVHEEHPAKEEKPTPTVAELSAATNEKPEGNNIYNFPRWSMGGIEALDQNQHVLMVQLSGKKKEEQNEDLITLAKINIANDRALEALGLLRIALQNVPELEENKEFEALRGAAFALSGKYDEAILDFSRSALKDYEDIKYWRAYTLAGLEDWKQAIEVMPKTFGGIAYYPKPIKVPLTLTFAEIALRSGNAPLALEVLNTLKGDLPKMPLNDASSWNYLAGEAARQKGDSKLAIEYWEPLVKNGKDDLFRAKAGLSLTKLQLDLKQIKSHDAIDRLEGLRYAWRGDELETLVNYRLGQMYIDDKDYLKGLTVLRNASTLSPGSELAQNVSAYMMTSFRGVFANERLKAMSPLDAISLHQEFKDLLPPGDESDKYVEQLAERLVEADLLGRAASLLEYQVNNRLKGDKKTEIAIRLAAIRLLDGNPDGALRSLEIAQDTLDKMAAGTETGPAQTKPQDVKPEAGEVAKPEPKTVAKETIDPEKQRQILLLKARALSMKKKTDEAMALLETMRLDPDVNRLRTDIAWSAGRWEEAAIALNDLIVMEDISPKRPLTDYQRDIIFNRAIALNLSGNRVALANLRERHNAQMKNTAKGQMFEIVTRPRRPDMIGSRDAISSMISEIDLFKGFLDGYTKMDAKPEAKEPAAPKEAVPAGEKPAADTTEQKAEAPAEEKTP